MSTHTEREQFVVRYEEEPVSVIEITTEPEVEVTQESLENYEKKSQHEEKNAIEDGTHVVSVVQNPSEKIETDCQEQKCDDNSRGNSNICTIKRNCISLCDKASTFTRTADRCFKCNICNKLFTYKSKLLSHTLCHTNEKPIKCKICNKTFTQKSYMKHMRTHTNEKPFKCNLCYKIFSTKGSLTLHICSHTNEKPFTCKICSKTFSQAGHLTGHMHIHTNEKPFKCKICNESFPWQAYLTRHMLSHTK